MSRKKILLGTYGLNLAFILFLWIRSSWPLFTTFDIASILLGIARLAGMVSALCVLTQLLLMGRIKWIEDEWGHERLVNLHRTNGKLIFYLIITHFVTVLTSYSMTANVSVFKQLLDFFQYYDDALNAFIGFLLFVFIALISIYMSKLKLKYELWYFIHFGMYVAILFAFGHQQKLGGTFVESSVSLYWTLLYVVVIVPFIYFRFVSPVLKLWIHRFTVVKVEPTTGNATSIYISGKNMNTVAREAGQFLIVRFLDKKRFWQAHPFSLSWGPRNENLRITVKDSGDFTHEISGLKSGVSVLIDGPHGKFTMNDQTSKRVLYIAGGIGITPIRSLLEDNAGIRDQILIYSNKRRGEVPLFTEIEALKKKFAIPVHYFYSEETKPSKGDFLGRVDQNAIKKLVPDFKTREVYLCGPEAFMQAMDEALQSLGVSSHKIHYEVFSFH